MHINLELEDPKTVVSFPLVLKMFIGGLGVAISKESFLWKWVYGIVGAIYRGCNLRERGPAPGLKKGISPEFHRPWVGVDFDTRGTGGWRDVSRDVPERVQNCPWF